uniref:Uncharacterized protein n=1 Tax=Anopheles maculatus TaxID=74869 RepID=A0A182SU39_9DIPT
MGWEEVGSSIKISENNVDNRLVVEVFGRQIHLNAILAKLEDALSGKSKKAEEVRFIAGTVFHVDANLDKEVWRGRNIVVYSDAVIVCQPVCWDVSGKDSHHVYDANAGTATDGNGLNGQDGYPGESGGNVLIIAKRVQCLEKLTILSNGGNGSKGQDGGNGAAGKDGKGICKVDLAKCYQSSKLSFYVKDRLALWENLEESMVWAGKAVSRER